MPKFANATIADAINEIQELASGVSGIRKAPDTPPESMNSFPYFVCFPGSGLVEREQGWLKEEHLLVGELHVARKDLPRDITKSIGYVRDVPHAILNAPSLSGTVENVGSIDYTFGVLNWSDEMTLGWQFSIPIRQTVPLTSPVYDYIGGDGDRPTLLDAITNIQEKMGTLARYTPTLAPEQLNSDEAIVTYPSLGTINRVIDWKKELHTVTTEIHVPRKDLPRDAAKVYPFSRTIPNALYNDPTIDRAANTINQIRYQFGALGWSSPGAAETLGFRFDIDLKIVV